MIPRGTRTLTRRLSRRGFLPEHAAEVGVYHPEASNLLDYLEAGVRCTLVEPDPESARRIEQRFGGRDTVTLHRVAVHDVRGALELVRRGPSTFARTLPSSPAIVNDGYLPGTGDRMTVDAVTFDTIDDGTIDLLSIDIEGGEWFVLRHLVSRPAAISIETHGALYVNPYLREIKEWMRGNGYRVWYKDKTDSVYVREGAIRVTSRDRLRLWIMNLRLGLRRARKRSLRKLGIQRNRPGQEAPAGADSPERRREAATLPTPPPP